MTAMQNAASLTNITDLSNDALDAVNTRAVNDKADALSDLLKAIKYMHGNDESRVRELVYRAIDVAVELGDEIAELLETGMVKRGE